MGGEGWLDGERSVCVCGGGGNIEGTMGSSEPVAPLQVTSEAASLL